MKKKIEILPVSEVADLYRKQFFPIQLTEDITCEEFVTKHISKFFNDGFNSKVQIPNGSKYWKGLQSTRLEYKKIHTEYFLF